MDKIETAVIVCTKGKKPLCLSGFWLLLFILLIRIRLMSFAFSFLDRFTRMRGADRAMIG